MSDLTSTVIKNLRSLNRGQFIGTHLSSTRTINHVVKIYQNHDVKIKTLHSPIIVPRSGFEELTLETSTAINAIPKIINNEIVLTKHKTISYYKFVPTSTPEKKFCPKYFINPDLKSVVNSQGVVLFDSSLLDKNGKSIYQEILSKKIKNLPRVRSRTLENIYDILHGKEFDYFLTVTFDDSKIDRSNPSLCSKVLRKRLNNIKNKVKGCSQLEYFGV